MFISFASCSNNVLSEKQVNKIAYDIVLKTNKSSIDTLIHWGFGYRGQAEVWYKNDSPFYSCFYFNRNLPEISFGITKDFGKEFPLSLIIDTSIIHQLIIKKIDKTNVCVSGWINNGRDTLIANKINTDKLFLKDNPFKQLAALSALKNKLKIIGTFYRPDIGNFIQLYISPEYALTYLPDNLYLAPAVKDIWMRYFSKGKYLTKNWNLRKLDRPLDNG